MDDRDFLAQMAQFSALESQQHMTRAMERQQAYAMIGLEVYAHFFCDASQQFREVQGPVLAITTRGDNIMLSVYTEVLAVGENGEYIRDEMGNIVTYFRTIDTPLDRVTWASGDSTNMHLQGILDGVANSRDIALIGNYVQAIIVENGRPVDFVEGRVDFVRIVDGQTVLMVNGQEILAGEVFGISERHMVLGREVTGVAFQENGPPITQTGRIANISVDGPRAYIELEGGGRIRLNWINELVEGLNFVGRTVTSTDPQFRGVVDSISIRSGYIHLHVGSQNVELGEFRTELEGRQVTTPPTATP